MALNAVMVLDAAVGHHLQADGSPVAVREKATLLWDGLPAHRSKAMRAWLGRQRHWLVVEPLPG